MFNIVEKNTEELITLKHGKNVFHEALSKIKEGEMRFHVTDDEKKVPDYDIVYTANMLLFPENVRALILKMTDGGSIYAPFLTYNEDDENCICTDFFKSFKKIEVEIADEYSIAVVRAALKYTDIPVFSVDERLKWFFEESDKLHFVEKLPEDLDKTALRLVPGPFDMGYTKRDWSYLSSVAAFQNLYFWQAFTSGKTGPFKFVEVTLSQIAGVGAILSNMSMLTNACKLKGYVAYLKPGCTRYPEELLCKYFHINPKPADATEENTIAVSNLCIFSTTWYCNQYPANFDESILDDNFAEEMNDYAEAVIGGKKTLGVLARGTDYRTNNLGDDRIHARPAHMIPVIKKWMEEGGYERIFLATEDKDIYDAILQAFPGKVFAIAQERHTVSELQEKNSTLIYEFERKINSGKAYADALEDTTVNYFYALFILSKCDAFMCSGQCNGWDVVRSFNKGKFEKEYKFAVGVEKPGSGRAVGGPILSGKSFMYTNGSFYSIGTRLIFKADVNPEILQKAVNQAVVLHPWVAYGIYEEDGNFYYHNKLTKILNIKEGDYETLPSIGGADAEGLLMGVFYKGKNVTVATFHGLTDGKGLMSFVDDMLKAYAGYLKGEVFTSELTEYEDINAEPFEVAGQLFEKMKLPELPNQGSMMDKEPFVVQKSFEADDIKPCHYLIKAKAADYTKFAKECEVRPAALLSAMYAKAVIKVMGSLDRKMKIAIPADFREALGIPHTFRNCAIPPIMMDIDTELANGDFKVLASVIQKTILQRTSNIAGIMAVKAMADTFAKIPKLPYKQTAGLFAGFSKGPVYTFNTSYAQRITENEYSSLLDEVYVFYPAEGPASVLEMVALPDSFCICMNQGGETREYVDAFLSVLSECGISAHLEEVLHGNNGYIELREFEKW
ncbi:MAG: hypothetical protein IK007_00440 [Lachnospiraceae bacterium]|nr:hypothetical protein [Lachnospiraceae bacterium]